MKKLLPVIILFLFINGCEQKKAGIEIIPNYDATYLPSNNVDTPAIDDKDFKAKMEKDLLSAVKSLDLPKGTKSAKFLIRLRLYINENGKIDKIKDLYDNTNSFAADSIPLFYPREKMDQAIASKLSQWKFSPAKKDGENVKYRTDINVDILRHSDGLYVLKRPDVLKNIFSSDDKFFVQVDQMPEIIGGIKSIQSKIKYPEIARRAGIEGKVYVLAQIDELGNVVNAKVIKGIGAGCDEAAINAVEGCKFTPGRQKGKAVKVQVTIPIVFRLN